MARILLLALPLVLPAALLQAQDQSPFQTGSSQERDCCFGTVDLPFDLLPPLKRDPILRWRNQEVIRMKCFFAFHSVAVQAKPAASPISSQTRNSQLRTQVDTGVLTRVCLPVAMRVCWSVRHIYRNAISFVKHFDPRRGHFSQNELVHLSVAIAINGCNGPALSFRLSQAGSYLLLPGTAERNAPAPETS